MPCLVDSDLNGRAFERCASIPTTTADTLRRGLPQVRLSPHEPGWVRDDQWHRGNARSRAAVGERHDEAAFRNRFDRARAVSRRAADAAGQARRAPD